MPEPVPPILDALGRWPGAQWLQGSGTAYLVVNAMHILGIGLLLGAILPLDLRLAGFFRGVPLAPLAAFLSRSAAVGVVLALSTGAWLFTVKPADYWVNTAFRVKVLLLVMALLNVAWQHRSGLLARVAASGAVSEGMRVRALASCALWLAVLLAGRWIGFL
ncbi:Uncharacterised protein [Xylophilus ampelinus]|nr:DUF2214 domain-containing protein [Variovorax sp.]VTY40259.1 Uncharacterised protein [Xylophilus ampelinus]